MKGSRPLLQEEIDHCIDSFQGKHRLRNQTLFILGLNTGFRISELLSLKIGDVLPYTKITDYLTVKRENMKGKHSGRTVILNEITKQYLSNYLGNFEDIYGVIPTKELYLFKSQKSENKPISTRQGLNVLNRVYQDNELTGKLATHSMRKTFAKNIHEALGEDITKTQISLGHRDISSTQHYLSFNHVEINDAIKNLNLGKKKLNLKNINEKVSINKTQTQTERK